MSDKLRFKPFTKLWPGPDPELASVLLQAKSRQIDIQGGVMMIDRLIDGIKMAVPPSVLEWAEVIADSILADGWMIPLQCPYERCPRCGAKMDGEKK